MLVDHPGTFLLRIQEEASGHWETRHRHNHVDWVFSEPEGRVEGCPVWSRGWRESSPSRSLGVNPAHPPLAFAGLVSSSSVGPAAASHPGDPKGLNPVGHQLVAHFHLSDIDQKVERWEDSWMVGGFPMMLLVVLPVDNLV